jgi:hypothetical protein
MKRSLKPCGRKHDSSVRVWAQERSPDPNAPIRSRCSGQHAHSKTEENHWCRLMQAMNVLVPVLQHTLHDGTQRPQSHKPRCEQPTWLGAGISARVYLIGGEAPFQTMLSAVIMPAYQCPARAQITTRGRESRSLSHDRRNRCSRRRWPRWPRIRVLCSFG